MYFLQTYSAIVKAIALGCIGSIGLWFLIRILYKSLDGRLPFHSVSIIAKIVRYGGFAIIASLILTQLGFNITALLGAAGVIGVALGFASQTSISNIISGIFLLMEHSFHIGDFIEINGIAGVVESVDLLSVRLKTSDGRLVRMPNELLIKSSVINKTFYQKRRLEFTVIVDRESSLEKNIEIAIRALQGLQVVADDPAPSVTLDSSTRWTVDLSIWCWVDARNTVSARSEILEALYDAYKSENRVVSLQ